jgi:hypothetical protein
MKRSILFLFLLLISFSLWSQKVKKQKPSEARIQLRYTRIFFTFGMASYAGAAYCTWNAFEAHQHFVNNFVKGYPVNLARDQKIFRDQMRWSIGLASAGIIFHGFAWYYFSSYKELMDNKISFRVSPTSIGLSYAFK